MKNYELTYLIKPDIAEEEIKSLIEKISAFIQEQGKLIKTSEANKRNLGYQIKDRAEALLVSLEFSFHPENLKSLEEMLKKENQVIRHIIVIKKKTKETAPRIKPVEPLAEKPQPDKKVELKEIDKKIEEILK